MTYEVTVISRVETLEEAIAVVQAMEEANGKINGNLENTIIYNEDTDLEVGFDVETGTYKED